MLEAQRQVLERLGFRIVAESEFEIVGVRSKWHWDIFATNMTYVVFLRATGPIAAANIVAEKPRLVAAAKHFDPFPLPSGFQHGRVAVPLYVADAVYPDAQQLCLTAPPVEFGTRYFPITLDRASGAASYLRSTPFWGGAYFSKFRWLAEHLVDPSSSRREPVSLFWSAYGVFMLLLLAFMTFTIVRVVLLIASS